MEHMQDEKKQIADKVRGVIAEKGFTQERTAKVLDMSRASFSDRLTGKVAFGAHEILTLAQTFDVPVTRFFPESASGRVVERLAS